MPYTTPNGEVCFKEYSILDTALDLDRGPNDECKNVFEMKVLDRKFTLYTKDNILMEKFVLYVEKILTLKQEI